MSKYKFGDKVFCETLQKFGIFQCYNPEDTRFCVVNFMDYPTAGREAEILTLVKSLQPANATIKAMNCF